MYANEATRSSFDSAMQLRSDSNKLLRGLQELDSGCNQQLAAEANSDILGLSLLLSLSQIISRLTFLTSSLITRLIQKIYTNIIKFKLFL